MAGDNPLCPTCEREMQFVKVGPKQKPQWEHGKVHVPLDSNIYTCAEHGMWRVYISGHGERYSE